MDKKGLKYFFSAASQLSVKTIQGLSYARARGFTLETVLQFFEPAMKKKN
jgi:hypothetical protein